MIKAEFSKQLATTLDQIEQQGLYKRERLIDGPQSAAIPVQDSESRSEVLNFCANNYLGLADHPDLVAAAKESLDQYGYGMASVRFICGTQTIHRDLEKKIADWLGYEDTILYAACFDANGGLFEPLLTAEDAIVSDSLNHASIIDGIRLCKAKRFRFANSDMGDLRAKLTEAKVAGARNIMIATDGVFSMDGYIAKLPEICDLADEFEALVMVDDCHSTGFLGSGGRGTAEHHDCMGRVDILTGTLGKALGGAMGGFTCASQAIIDILRQRSRPYLFSNSLAPALVGASMKAIDLVSSKEGDERRKQLFENANRFRAGMSEAGFTLPDGEHPIIPVMLGDAELAQRMSAKLLEKGIYVVGFFYPVVPKETARIRTQMSAGHSSEQVDQCVQAFIDVGKELGVI
ncbi:glycine C-acetyltransferase [Mariniblastus fucicola]|uniref:2-amino-3-ketobutyrate coenzyme A ligase n=1 Tax=Mariniblastus fucicola TaxID=980251 RepID=A0A5B9P3E9_9BACT|nr:glycine C-acetyltransferase [Mariniblastus fucicola]QEG20918.1 2-amino-3-ketobutyrate coenzyme A ligase [Mariniblastus fucicola]